MNTPEFVKRDGIIADNEYVEWLHELKQRYQQSQAKAAVRVNQSLLEFYWSLGHDIVQKRAERVADMKNFDSYIIESVDETLENVVVPAANNTLTEITNDAVR